MPTDEEIEEALTEATARAVEPSRYRNMTYEQGVRDALAWITGDSDENPMADS